MVDQLCGWSVSTAGRVHLKSPFYSNQFQLISFNSNQFHFIPINLNSFPSTPINSNPFCSVPINPNPFHPIPIDFNAFCSISNQGINLKSPPELTEGRGVTNFLLMLPYSMIFFPDFQSLKGRKSEPSFKSNFGTTPTRNPSIPSQLAPCHLSSLTLFPKSDCSSPNAWRQIPKPSWFH